MTPPNISTIKTRCPPNNFNYYYSICINASQLCPILHQFSFKLSVLNTYIFPNVKVTSFDFGILLFTKNYANKARDKSVFFNLVFMIYYL